jgi:predicted O-methyltransferase YrrM
VPQGCVAHGVRDVPLTEQSKKELTLESNGWSNGYVTDNTYTTEFYLELSPEYLNAACVLQGVEPVPLDRPFTYLELGCGHGLSSVLLAASNPHGRFYANDFMPTHVATAQSLASAGGIENLTMLENSFDDLVKGRVDLPQFDFITMHGVYTWVSRENRREIVDILSRYLKPGGIVYISYNALPGWAPALALQRLLLSQASMKAGEDSAQRFVQARDFVENLVGAGAKYFEANPGLKHELDSLRKADPAYLVHEYLHSGGWEPMYHADVASDLARAKMEYIGSAILCSTAIRVPPERRQLLDSVPDPVWRETVNDFIENRRFRKDIFVRGRRAMPAGLRHEWLQRSLLALSVPRDQASYGFDWTSDEERAAAGALLDDLAQAPLSLAEVADRQVAGATPRPLFGRNPELVYKMAMLMIDNARAVLCQPRADIDSAPALRLNRAIAERSRHVEQFKGLASPLTGNGIRATLLERLVYAELVDRPDETSPEAITGRVRAHLQAQGRDAGDGLGTQVGEILQTTVPLWRRLKAI